MLWEVPLELLGDVRLVRLASHGLGIKLVLRQALALGDANANAAMAKHRANTHTTSSSSGSTEPKEEGWTGRPGVMYEARQQLDLWLHACLEHLVRAPHTITRSHRGSYRG